MELERHVDLNRRRPAWEIEGRLKIENLASMVSMQSDAKLPSFNGLLRGLR